MLFVGKVAVQQARCRGSGECVAEYGAHESVAFELIVVSGASGQYVAEFAGHGIGCAQMYEHFGHYGFVGYEVG